MKTVYTNMDIEVKIEETVCSVLNIVFERFLRAVPKHSHGINSYEMHYISRGCGSAHIDGSDYRIVPNTLYMTGPNVEHAQFPDEDDPMEEYCIYFKLRKDLGSAGRKRQPVTQFFENTRFWFGQDTQDIHTTVRQIFSELEQRRLGCMIQVEALLQQCLIKIVRNYQYGHKSEAFFSPPNLMDSKYIVTEEGFLYEYGTLSLESLSKRLGLSMRQTERFLKEYYGKTFLRKKTEAKMAAAKLYLKDKNLSVSEIAERLNYSSVQHFSYAFKQYHGMTASDYRRNNAD
ncbi:MAG: AraC family transcriptional regulator [Clostridiales Family XIII bacterium]|nr:AraC family transcriptional regulator [Clostridiales Family XIII bacterium]